MSILHWSRWRRWHQAWARYYHYRRRQAPAVPLQEETIRAPALIEVVWHRLASLLPPTQRTGRPVAHERRLVLEAIVYVMHSDCAWRALPSRFPPWQTVYAQLCRWRATGIWDQMWVGLEQPHPSG